MNKYKGYTVIELLCALSAIASLALVAVLVWIVAHFIAKYW